MWQLDGNHACWTAQNFNCSVDLLRPQAGIAIDGVVVQRTLTPLCLHTSASPEALHEAYVRGPDVVASYGDPEQRPVVPQVYWRIGGWTAAGVLLTIDMIVSVHTWLLDSNPALTVSTEIGKGELFRRENGAWTKWTADSSPLPVGAACGWLFRPIDTNWSYAELTLPSDLASNPTMQLGDGRRAVRYQLFAERLEKGVIRRARLRGVFLPRGDDHALANAAHDDLISAAPPLTA